MALSKENRRRLKVRLGHGKINELLKPAGRCLNRIAEGIAAFSKLNVTLRAGKYALDIQHCILDSNITDEEDNSCGY